MGAMGLLGITETTWLGDTSGLLQVETELVMFTVLFPGGWPASFTFPDVARWNSGLPMAADTLGTCGLVKPEFRVPY